MKLFDRKIQPMGQSHSIEGLTKEINDEVPESGIFIVSAREDHVLEEYSSEALCYDTNAAYTNSPLFTFLSGFYQKSSVDTHIFYQLSFDDVRRIAEYAKNWKVLPYTGNPEEHGIIYWIGCLNEAHQYMNPITQNAVEILTSRDYHEDRKSVV